MDLIYYHDACPDGWASAVIGKMKYPEAQLRPLKYGTFDPNQVIEESRDKDVLMADFSLKTLEQNVALANSAKTLLVLDHHKTSVTGQMANSTTAKFVLDMERSGCGLTWDYLFGKDSGEWNPADPTNAYRPWWINYTEDQDLWRFKLPDSRIINAWLNVQPREIEFWTNNVVPLRCVDPIAVKGAAIQQQIDYHIRHAMEDVQKGYWNGASVGIVNNGHVGSSEVGEAIYNAGYDIALLWREDGRGVIRFGLRSKKIDVGTLAKMFPGGGGHAAASGFELPLHQGRGLLDAILGRGEYVASRSN